MFQQNFYTTFMTCKMHTHIFMYLNKVQNIKKNKKQTHTHTLAQTHEHTIILNISGNKSSVTDWNKSLVEGCDNSLHHDKYTVSVDELTIVACKMQRSEALRILNVFNGTCLHIQKYAP